MQNQIAADKVNTWLPAKIEDDTAQVIEKPNLIEAVHTLSLYPGSVPNDSGILHYFKIDPGDWTPKNADLIAAVPKLEMSFNGKKLLFTPKPFDLAQPADFNFDEWQNGWKYIAEEDGTVTADFELTAFVKPLQIADVTGIFYDETEKPTADSGLNFKDYWFRSQKSPLWQNQLEDFADAVTDFDKRMAEAAAIFTDSPVVSSDLWEDLRLMALGLYAQWETLSGGINLPAHGKMAAIEKIIDLIAGNDAEKPALKIALETAVNEIRLSLKTGDRRQKRKLWLDIFRRGFGDNLVSGEDDRQYAETLLKRAAETPEDFRATLFYIWDFAVHRSDSTVFKRQMEHAK